MNSVAAILTVYKNDQFDVFRAAISSLYNQSIEKLTIYVQEDGVVSADIHAFLLSEVDANRVFYLGIRNVNKGFDYSLNEVIKLALAAGHDYIVRMDADDLSVFDRLEKQFCFMQDNKKVDVCGTYIREFGDQIKYDKVVQYPLVHDEMLSFFKKRVPIAHVTAFFRRSYFEKAGFYEVEGHFNNGDTLMWMKGFNAGCKFANVNFIGVNVRVSKDFFGRRGGWQKTASDFKNRMTVNKRLNYGFSAYFYAVAVAIVNMMPPLIKKYAYKYLR
ncbi:glycosyltransferase [Planktomarina sp.]|nr:glycosyltransferase [Planktomarina sp.]